MDSSIISLYPPQALHQIGGRSNNEDSIFPRLDQAGQQDRLFLVCDGVGGADKGEIASALLCEYMPEYFHLHPGARHDRHFIEQALRHAEGKMSAYLELHPEARNMGTTLTLLSLQKGHAALAWVGDSRVYQVRNGEIIYRTEDHSLVNTLLRQGEITEEEAKNHPQRNVIMRAVHGADEPAKIDVVQLEDIQPNDFFLLCTDGLLEQVSDEIICQKLLQDANPQELKEEFLQLCLGKTRDNFSMYLLKVKDAPGNKEDALGSSEESSMGSRTAPEYPEELENTDPEVEHVEPSPSRGWGHRVKWLLIGTLFLVLLALLVGLLFWKTTDKDPSSPARPVGEVEMDSAAIPTRADKVTEETSDRQVPDSTAKNPGR